MIPVPATPEQVAYWTERDGTDLTASVIGGPAEAPDVIPCPALVGILAHERPDGSIGVGAVHHVAMQLDEIELAQLAQGGTLWLSTWGGLPIHFLEVVPK